LKERTDAEYANRRVIANQYQTLHDKAIEQMKKIGCRPRNDLERVLQDLETSGTWAENLREASYRVLETFSLKFPATIDELPTTLERAAGYFGRLRDAGRDLMGYLEIPLVADPLLFPDQLCDSINTVVAEVKKALVKGVHEMLALFGAHFEDVDFAEVIKGFPIEYTQEQLEKIRQDTRTFAEDYGNILAPDTDAQGRPVERAADPRA
jgi:hypothetical protein